MITTSGNHLFSFILFIAIGLVLWLRISVEATHYVSPDSEFYLKVAENIKQGKGLIAPPRNHIRLTNIQRKFILVNGLPDIQR